MKQIFLKGLLSGILAVVLSLQGATAAAMDTSQSKVVHGMAVYLGIFPAEIILGHPKEHPESEMHGGVPGGKHKYHVVIALFDNATGKRVTDAEVKANVAEIGLAGQEKKLEPMKIADTVTYGNYFEMIGSNPYKIKLQIRRKGEKTAREAEFEVQHVR
ncbi:MAG: hypothetical protein AB1810_06135 [Pseudomonadota bacterium]